MSRPTPEIAARLAGFPRFTDLPLELQLIIWKDSHPELRPALFPHYDGCCEHQLDSNGNDMLVHHEECLPGVPYKLPMHSIDHMACRATVKFMKENDFERSPEDDGQTFMRIFNPAKDVMFVPASRFLDFDAAEDDSPAGSDESEYWEGKRELEVRTMATDAAHFYQNDWPCLLSVCEHYPSLKTLLIVVGCPDELKVYVEDGEDYPRDRWEFDALSDVKFVWNKAKLAYEQKGTVPKDLDLPKGLENIFGIVREALEADAEELQNDAAGGLPVAIPDGFEVKLIIPRKAE